MIEPLETAGARCRLYWDAPPWDGRPAAAVGSFECTDAAAGAALLERV